MHRNVRCSCNRCMGKTSFLAHKQCFTLENHPSKQPTPAPAHTAQSSSHRLSDSCVQRRTHATGCISCNGRFAPLRSHDIFAVCTAGSFLLLIGTRGFWKHGTLTSKALVAVSSRGSAEQQGCKQGNGDSGGFVHFEVVEHAQLAWGVACMGLGPTCRHGWRSEAADAARLEMAQTRFQCTGTHTRAHIPKTHKRCEFATLGAHQSLLEHTLRSTRRTCTRSRTRMHTRTRTRTTFTYHPKPTCRCGSP